MKPALFATLLAISTLAGAESSGWQKEVVYQIFPRSFYDSNGDHIGDLRGIEQKLGYLHGLGFTAILINPIFASRFYHNYFADDFMKVDPTLGSNKDFFDLVGRAHKLGMKVILDVEVQYVADKHPWYRAVKDNPNSPYAKYIWTMGSKVFGDKLPSYDGRSIGFATLNPDDPGLRSEIQKVFRYWAAPDGNSSHGVDGFRIDHMMDDLDSQHVKTGMLSGFWLPIEQSIRTLNPNIFFLGEQSDWGLGADLFAKAKVDAVYAIPLWGAWISHDKQKIEHALRETVATMPVGKTEFVFIENHDTKRYASAVDHDPGLLRLGAVFQFTMAGTPMVYYGQELSMAGIQGKWGNDGNDIPIRLAYRWTKTVDGNGAADFYRNSGPWANTGYTKDADGVSVEEERNDPRSLLNFYKRVIELRLSTPALQEGSFRPRGTKNPHLISYERTTKHQTVRVLLNLSKDTQTDSSGSFSGGLDLFTRKRLGPSVTLGPHGFVVCRVN